ncbi:MAG TPA: ABC transporter permease [Candidatus Angelobacter sp.]|nr:ABC transporter permease [Candidatus Angelobacter sp.]
MDSFRNDLKYSLRMFMKSRTFTIVAVLTLALGIGANTAIFSYINAFAIQPLPFPHADRLMVFLSNDAKKGWIRESLTSTASFLDYQKQNTLFEQTVLWGTPGFNITNDGMPALVRGGRVSWNFFDALGAKPMLGRSFTPDDDRAGAPRVVILDYGFWQSRYAGDRNIVGHKITINGEPYVIIGVMPANFQFPLVGIANLWVPLALSDKERADRASSSLTAFGVLKPGVTEERAQLESGSIYARLAKQFPETNADLTLLVGSMSDEIKRKEGTPELLICLVVVALILLIACANVANLMLARATYRSREFAVRAALGATRRKLVQQLLTESVLLFLLGGVAGTLFGLWGVRWIEAQIPDRIRGYLVNYGHVNVDFATLAFTTGITLMCGLLFGLVPARENATPDLNHSLKEEPNQTSGSKSGGRIRRFFVASEVALATIVLVSTALLIRSFSISVYESPGFNANDVLVTQLALPTTKYAADWRIQNFTDDALSRLRSLPQVTSVAAASSIPFGRFAGFVKTSPTGGPVPLSNEQLSARYTAVSRTYFSVMEIPLARGRMFDSSDAQGSAPSVIVNETLARDFWPDKDPVGQQLRFGENQTVATVVGVVRDIKTWYMRQRPEAQLYVPLEQFPSSALAFVVRTQANPTTMATAVHNVIQAIDADEPISSLEPLENLMLVSGAGDRVMTKLMLFFGAVTLLLAAIGIYGVMSDFVSHRTRELGIRIALGARPVQLLRMVIFQGMKIALIGITVGVFCALGAARIFASLLYQVKPNDLLTFIAVPIVFATIAMIACYFPARRALDIAPVAALRQ